MKLKRKAALTAAIITMISIQASFAYNYDPSDSVDNNIPTNNPTEPDKIILNSEGLLMNDSSKNDRVYITNVKNGSVTETSKDAVNGSQLFGVKTALEGSISGVEGRINALEKVNVFTYDENAGDILSLKGKDGISITNVKNGSIAKTSKDAVNGGQLFGVKTALEGSISGVEGRINSLEKVNAFTYDENAGDTLSLKGKEGTSITNLKKGAITKTSTDAVNGSQLYEVNEKISATNKEVSSIKLRLDAIDPVNTMALISQVKGEVKHIGAISAALAGLHPLVDEGEKFSIAAASGMYSGSSAVALGLFYRPTESFMMSAASSLSSGEKAYNIGISYKFGASTFKSKRQLNHELEEMKTRMKKLEEQVSRLLDENLRLKSLSNERKSFSDVPSNHWAAEAVETLHGNNIVEGYPNGEFNGDQKMTRYEYAQMLYKLTGVPASKNSIDECNEPLAKIIDLLKKNPSKPISLESKNNPSLKEKALEIREYLQKNGIQNEILLDGKPF